jgi:transposase
MKKIRLNKDQIFELRIAHSAERNRNAAYKINAVILLGTGWKIKDVKKALLLDDETLRSYIEKYQAGGISELIKTNYSGRQVGLDNKQLKFLHTELDNNIYLTTSAIIEFVQKTFNVTYTMSGIRDLLHREGYAFKKPKLVPGDPDIDAQEDFVRCYDKFMETKNNSVEVVFIDAVHPEHNTMAGYGWIKKGEQRKLKTNSGRQRLNLHGAINAETMEMTLIESDTINRDSTVQLLELLDRKYFYATEIIVILDNASYHYSQEVRDVIEKSSRLKLVYLPTYSPELNLIERVWKFFKKKVLYNKYYENLSAFRKATIDFFQNFDNYADELSSLLGGGFEGHHYA